MAHDVAHILQLARSGRHRRVRPGHHLPMMAILFALAVLAVLMLTRLGLNAFGMFVRDAGKSADPTPVEVTVGAVPLEIPGNMIRFASDRGGELSKVDLFVHWPTGEGYSVERAPLFQPGVPDVPVVYLTIRPADRRLSPQERFRSVYPRVLADAMREEPGGIVVREFKPGYGYDGEELYIARDSEHPLAARCGSDDGCLAEFRTSDGRFDVSYRFGRGQIDDWRHIDTTLRGLVERFAKADQN